MTQLLPVLAALSFLGCSNPADNVPEATVGPASKNAGETKIEAKSQLFVIDQSASKIEFTGSKVTGKHDGGFREFTGEFHVVDGKIADTGNKVVIQTASIWSDSGRLTGHLKTPDFFDVAGHPTATFESISVKSAGDTATVTGNLTLHGITKAISFPAKIQVSESEVTVIAEFFVDRFDFDMKYAGKADDLIRKEVVLKLNIKAVPGRANAQAVATPKLFSSSANTQSPRRSRPFTEAGPQCVMT